jgi:hypothetical protein
VSLSVSAWAVNAKGNRHSTWWLLYRVGFDTLEEKDRDKERRGRTDGWMDRRTDTIKGRAAHACGKVGEVGEHLRPRHIEHRAHCIVPGSMHAMHAMHGPSPRALIDSVARWLDGRFVILIVQYDTSGPPPKDKDSQIPNPKSQIPNFQRPRSPPSRSRLRSVSPGVTRRRSV